MATDSDPDAETPPVETARDEFQGAVPEAAETLRDLLEAEDERVQIRAEEAILDRAGLRKASGHRRGERKSRSAGRRRTARSTTCSNQLYSWEVGAPVATMGRVDADGC